MAISTRGTPVQGDLFEHDHQEGQPCEAAEELAEILAILRTMADTFDGVADDIQWIARNLRDIVTPP